MILLQPLNLIIEVFVWVVDYILVTADLELIPDYQCPLMKREDYLVNNFKFPHQLKSLCYLFDEVCDVIWVKTDGPGISEL